MLTSIMGHAQLAAMRLPQSHPVRAHIEEIGKSSERASNLTRQLLTVSRQQIVEPRIINLNRLIMNMVPRLHPLVGVDIELVTNPKSDLGLVKVDPGQFEQVLLNLVVNARDALPQGGQIVIETANVTLDQSCARQHSDTPPNPQVMLSVSDNGLGMNEEVKAHLFEPFFTIKEEGKGTGLGLAICYGIVKQSGGYIELPSELGRGTTFRIYLPQTEEEMAADTGPGEARENRLLEGKETVLLAEDEPLVRTMIASMLQDQGYAVLQATNGAEGLQLAQEHAGTGIHLLLTDVVMPHMGGVELANQFSAIRPETRVLFTSGHPEQLLPIRKH
jgi:two-component system, cell cycle sensor histidine kinase and response regulator CckA